MNDHPHLAEVVIIEQHRPKVMCWLVEPTQNQCSCLNHFRFQPHFLLQLPWAQMLLQQPLVLIGAIIIEHQSNLKRQFPRFLLRDLKLDPKRADIIDVNLLLEEPHHEAFRIEAGCGGVSPRGGDEDGLDGLGIGLCELIGMGVESFVVRELLESRDPDGVDTLEHKVDVPEGLQVDHHFVHGPDDHRLVFNSII